MAASISESDLTVLYTKHSPLNWSATTIGFFFTLRTVLKALTLSLGLPLFFKLAKHHSLRMDLSLASFGIISTTSALVMISFAETTTVMMIAPFVGMFVGFPSLILNAIKSKLVEPYEYGALFAFTALIQTLTSTAGSAMFSSIYAASLATWPGLAFMVTALIYVVSLGLISYLWFDMKKAAEDDQRYQSDDGSGYEKVDTTDEESD
ncbi:solute carrier family 46 member 3-like [Asterias rubens]|uniref:solute carrier family 46 member 3-like n=1 Tax=Asterias rubens TaxID=7604 RepID=UPI001455895B|nr:solute carrier family 46 member 3-like [Asterias rubens]